MIIFDLDSTLANCEHRRHFVDRDKAAEMGICYEEVEITFGGFQNGPWVLANDPDRLWKPDWNSFYDACDKDTLILPVAFQFYAMREKFGIQHPIVIWSGRCESVREKTIDWLKRYFSLDINWTNHLKMRPIGDYTPDDVLKERWLDEVIAEGKTIDFVFDDRPKVVRMWQRRGIFVFNCAQNDEEF